MVEDGIDPELLLGHKYGHALHFWDLAAGKHLQRVDLGEHHQDLSPSVWRWYRGEDGWSAEKVITIPAEPADPDLLPPAPPLRRGCAAGHRHQPRGGDPTFFPHGEDFHGRRVHQVRLQGGDASSDSCCHR